MGEDTKKFCGGLHLSTFLSTHAEWHALVFGFAHGYTFIKTNWQAIEEIAKEGHYYAGGAILGRVILAITIGVILEVII